MATFYVPDFKQSRTLRERLRDIYFRWVGMPFYQRRVDARMVFPVMGDIKGKRVLDIGCGDGIFDIEMARRGGVIEALDLSNSALERARWRVGEMGLTENINFIRGDATHLPYPDSTFDIVFSNCVLEHISDDQGALMEASRVLKSGGMLVITVPREYENWDRVPARLAKAMLASPRWLKKWIGSEPIKQAAHFRQYVDLVLIPYDQVRVGYSEREISDKMNAAGLKITAIKGYFKMFGTWGIDIMEGFSAFRVHKGGDFGYTARHDWLHGLAFPLFFGLAHLDNLLPRSAPSMAMAVVALKK